ncbi:MAG: ATP-binding protein [Lysobacteraceae bacterium]
MSRLGDFLASMVGRIFVILLLGVALTAALATALANWQRQHENAGLNTRQAVGRVADFVSLVEQSSGPLRKNLLEIAGQGIQPRDGMAGSGTALPDGIERTGDADFDRVAATQGLSLARPSWRLSPEACLPGQLREHLSDMQRRRAEAGLIDHSTAVGETSYAGNAVLEPPVCRWVDVVLSDGSIVPLSVGTPPVIREPAPSLDPWMLVLLALVVAALAYGIARMAAAPLLSMARAATELGRDLDRQPIPIRGPTEVTRAAAAFNTMQGRLQSTLRERTHMLAAITHDLQTPLTRLRLRLEKVEDESLRERLVADMADMQVLIREGLDLARSADAIEERVSLDLDSLLESLVEDGAEAGLSIRFEGGCNTVLRVRPLAMRRVFSNLIDNACKYGGAAVVRARREGRMVLVTVNNPGKALPEDRIEEMFKPFVRLETSRSRETGGIGLGLTIARTLAEREGATLELHNKDAGIEAVVCWSDPDIVG